MKQILSLIGVIACMFISFSFFMFEGTEKKSSEYALQDTCIIEGMIFKIYESDGPQQLDAVIKNGRIKIITDDRNENYRIIRYVFSIILDEKIPLVRSYSDLVSYPVIQNLKKSHIGEVFYFEEIIIVDSEKKILNNEVRPIVIERVK